MSGHDEDGASKSLDGPWHPLKRRFPSWSDHEAYHRGASDERARIVSWLRDEDRSDEANYGFALAARIEKLEHKEDK